MAEKEFKIVIRANTSDVKQAMAQVATSIEAVGGKIEEVNNNATFSPLEEKIKKVSKQLTSIGDSMTKTGKNLTTKLSLPLMGLGTMAVKTFGDFEYGMKKVQAVTGASAEELKKMTALAREMGASTEYSATEAAEGMFNLSTAGFSVEETMSALPGLLDMATAGQTDLGTASEIAAGTLRGFGMEASQISQVADVLAYTANATNASVTDLGLGMSYVAPLAKTAGISMEETTAILGKLSDANLKGEKAGTALRGMLARLLDPSTEAADTLASLGLSVDDVNPSMHSMAEVIGTLAEKGLSTAQIMKIFGQEAGPGAAILLGQGEEGIRKLTKELENSGGSAKETAEIMRDSFKQTWDDFTGDLEDLAITMGSVIVPAITPILEAISKLANKFADLSPSVQKVIVYVGMFAVALGPALVALGSVVGAIGNLYKAFKNIGTAFNVMKAGFAALSSPIGIAVVAIAGLVAIGYTVYKNWDAIIAKLTRLWDNFKNGVSTRIEKLKKIYGGLLTPFPELIAKMKKAGTDLIQGLINGIKAKIKGAVEAVKNVGSSIVTGLKGLLGIHSPSTVMQEIGNNIMAGLQGGMEEKAEGVVAEAQDVGERIHNVLLEANEKLNNEILKMETELNKKREKQDEERVKAEIKAADEEVEASKKKVAQLEKELKKVEGNAKKEKEVKEKLTEEMKKLAEAQKKAAEQRATAEDNATQKIIENMKNQATMLEKLRTLWDNYNKDITSAKEDYYKKVEQLNNNLISSEKQLTEKYETELSNRAKSIADFVGLFSEVKVKDVSGQQLLANLQAQVDTLDKWRENLDILASRGIDDELLTSLREMGAGSASEIQALVSLSDEELDKYVQLWQERNEQAREEATEQLKGLKVETAKEIRELRNNVSEQLAQYEAEWKAKNAEIKENTVAELQAMVTQAQIQGNAFVVGLATSIQQALPGLYEVMAQIPGMAVAPTGDNGQVAEAQKQKDGVLGATAEQSVGVISSTTTATQTVIQTWQNTGNILNETHNLIREKTLEIWNDLYTKMSALWLKMLEDTKKTWGEQQKFILEVLGIIQTKFNELVAKSEGWGISLMSGFISGIKSKKDDLIEALEEMTSLVDAYMPQSPADKGALRKLDKYGVSFVNTFAEGITNSIPILEKAMSGLALTAVPVMAGTGQTAQTQYDNSTSNAISITINGSNNDDILDKLMRELHRRGVRF